METNQTRQDFVLSQTPHYRSTLNSEAEICQHRQIRDHGHFFADFVAAVAKSTGSLCPVSLCPAEILTLLPVYAASTHSKNGRSTPTCADRLPSSI